MLRGWRVLVPGLLLTGSACAHGGGGAPQPADSPVRVEVTNHYSLPMDVYVVGSGINHRMGTVHPGMVGHFVVPQTMIGNGPVEFQAGSFRSGPLLLSPGAIVDFVIAEQLFNSTATIRP